MYVQVLQSLLREVMGYIKTQLSCILLYYADDDINFQQDLVESLEYAPIL